MAYLRLIYYALVPLFILISATFIACLLGYLLVLAFDNQLSLAKTISKITQVLLVLSIYPIMRLLKLTKTDLGFCERKFFIKQLKKGFFLGFLTLLPVFALLYFLNVHIIDETKTWTMVFFLQKAVFALLTALLIALLEESLFRGMLLVGLQKKFSLIMAVLLSAFYYSALHFLQNKTIISSADLNLLTAFDLALQAFSNLFNSDIISAFIALFMVGLFLAMIRVCVPNSLVLCIGFHSSWVFQIKMSKDLFNTDIYSKYAYLVSNYDGVIGLLVSVWLFIAIALYLKFAKNLSLKKYCSKLS